MIHLQKTSTKSPLHATNLAQKSSLLKTSCISLDCYTNPVLLCFSFLSRLTLVNKYFELKNSRGAGALLNSNYLLAISPCMFNKSDSWGYSIADGLKDTSRYNRLLGLQEFQVSRAASHPVKAPLLNCQNVCRLHFDLYNILNEDVLVTLCLEEEHADYKATL